MPTLTTMRRSLHRRRSQRPDRPGFTILELVVTLLVVGVLAAIVAPSFRTVTSQSVVNVTNRTLEAIDRNGEAMAKANSLMTDSAIAATAAAEIPATDGVTVTASGPTVTATIDRSGTTASGTVTFSGGIGTIAAATITGGHGGPTTTVALGLSYTSTLFDINQSSQTLTATVTGGSSSNFAVTSGSLPTGVTLNPVTGALTGSAAWGANVTRIAVGPSSHGCAVTSAGAARCWGFNIAGQLGDGTTTDRTTSVAVSGLGSGVAEIAVGNRMSCAVTDAGAAHCWGQNDTGQLGDGTTTDRLTPVTVSGLGSGVSQIAAGNGHTCALTTAGGVKCWGDNNNYQMGDGTRTQRNTPVNVSGLTSGVAAIAVGGNFSCALTTSGGVKCWGSNDSGQLGDGSGATRYGPVDVTGLTSGVASISAGSAHACAVTTSGGAKCWGQNGGGRLGDGTVSSKLAPVDVSGLTSGVASISAGDSHTCAVTTSGGVKCWGRNWYGELGDGTTSDSSTAVDVTGLTSGASLVRAGGYFTCATTTAGGAKCWGYGSSGALGNGASSSSTTPVNVTGLAGNPGFPAPVTITATAADGRTANASISLTLG